MAEQLATSVKELHEEMFQSTMNRVRSASTILKNNREILENEFNLSNELKKLGFTSSKNMGVQDPSTIQVNNSADLKDLKELKDRYLIDKIMHIDDIKTVCKKYGLVWGWPEDFTGEIPTKNAEEITRNYQMRDKVGTYLFFASRCEHFRPSVGISGIEGGFELTKRARIEINGYDVTDISSFDDYAKIQGLREKRSYIQLYVNFLQLCCEETNQVIQVCDEAIIDTVPWEIVDNVLLEGDTHSVKVSEKTLYHRLREFSINSDNIEAKRDKDMGLTIIATPDQFKEGLNLNQDHPKISRLNINEVIEERMKSIAKWIEDDPIVLQRTNKKNYFRVLSAWDIEASDPLVMNEILN